MVARISVLSPVGNGDMTLIVFESGCKLLIDMKIRAAADDPDDDTPDVAAELRSLSDPRCGRAAVYRRAPDQPSRIRTTAPACATIFILGAAGETGRKFRRIKIFIRELWSSPLVFRRASSQHILCPDAKAFNSEARRRVARFRAASWSVSDGDRILILGEDEDGKTPTIHRALILVKADCDALHGERTSTIWSDDCPRLLAPQPRGDDEGMKRWGSGRKPLEHRS